MELGSVEKAAATTTSSEPPTPPRRSTSSQAAAGDEEADNKAASDDSSSSGASTVADEGAELKEGPPLVVKSADFADAQRQRAFELIRRVGRECTVEREMALIIKKSMDQEYGPKWQCIVGKHFSSHISYEPHHYLYVQQGRRVFLLFKAGG